MSFDSGYVRVTGGPATFYDDYTATNLYVERPFGALANTLTISNDSTTDNVQISYDSATLEAELHPRETLTLNTATKTSVYIKGTAGGDKVRIWGW